VEDTEDGNLFLVRSIEDRIRKSTKQYSADPMFEHAWNLRHPFDPRQSLFHGGEELVTKPFSLFLVPSAGGVDVRLGLRADEERAAHF
jgi:hypothetical protein